MSPPSSFFVLPFSSCRNIRYQVSPFGAGESESRQSTVTANRFAAATRITNGYKHCQYDLYLDELSIYMNH